jgi:hydroxymethylpyrimidine/phosphomethylpyrimidine kinase
MPSKPPVVLSIAGYDPSSGAGVTADIKTIAAHGCYGITCVTALTVQTTQGVTAVEPVRDQVVRQTLDELHKDFRIAAVRIGMLGSAARVIAAFLEQNRMKNVVLDPVLKSSSGADLVDGSGLLAIRSQLLPHVDVVTPNVEEATALTGVEDRHEAARKLRELGARAVVITGGDSRDSSDLLFASGEFEEFKARKIESRSTHGTGCAFATSIACGLAKGNSIRDAVISAKAFVRDAIEKAYPVGKGTGPLNHLYRLKSE